MQPSLVTESIQFANTKDEVFAVVIDTMTKLGRGGPNVDRLLGKVSGPIKRSAPHFVAAPQSSLFQRRLESQPCLSL